MHRHIRTIFASGLFGLGLTVGAHASSKFDNQVVDCEQFFLFQRTPVLKYDIPKDHETDYTQDNGQEYWGAAADRLKAYCESLPNQPAASPLGPRRRIVGVWFQSRDDRFKLLWNTDEHRVDGRVNVVNVIDDLAQQDRKHKQQLADIALRAQRQQEVVDAENRAKADAAARASALLQQKAAQEVDMKQAFFLDRAAQMKRLGTQVDQSDFVSAEALRTNAFHYKKSGRPVVIETTFNRMLDDKTAFFGNDADPIFVTVPDPDHFLVSGQRFMIAMTVTNPTGEELHNSFGEMFMAKLMRPSVNGSYVGSFACQQTSCNNLYDLSLRNALN